MGKRALLWKSQHPTEPQPVEVWDALAALYHGWFYLGRDMNGGTLYSDRRNWLDENGWSEPGERDAGMYFFTILEGTAAEIHSILYPPPKDKGK